MIRVLFNDEFPERLTSPDVYFTPGYGRASTVVNPGEWCLIEAFDGAWQVPLILRSLVDGTKDAISPYGYSGVCASPSLSSAQVQQAWSETLTCLRELGIVSVLLRHSPLVPQAPHLSSQKWVVDGHPTIVLEPEDSDSAWNGMEGNCRTAIRKALKNGYAGWIRQASSQDLTSSGDFCRLYEQTMARRSAEPLYFFDSRYYRELLDGLGSNLLIAEVRDREGAVVSSTLLMRHAQRLHYHLSGSNLDDARMGVNNLLLWTATQFAIAQGLRQFHLGGGVGPRDGLFEFKRSFGGRELKYGVSGLIIDPERYRARTQNRAKECGITTETLSSSRYFPAYRGGSARV